MADALLVTGLVLRTKKVIWNFRQGGCWEAGKLETMAEIQIKVLVAERVPTNSTSARTYGSSRSTLRERITEESLPSGMTSPDQGKTNPNELT
jgi:hypothetical protein